MPFGLEREDARGRPLYNEETTADVLLTAWLSTTASQMFFMQLGFLCYEVGHVSPIWATSIVIKNIEDTFVGIMAFVFLGFSLSQSPHSFYGIIGGFNHPFLYKVTPKWHEEIFVAAAFATTTATIISGAVLERMKNKAYLVWCFVIVVVVWSPVAHWVWNPKGWLMKLGFMDGAGSCVVHMTGGMCSFVAVYFLGPRHSAVNSRTGRLKKPPPAARPIIVAIGYFILWYGWFAFNISSPVAMHLDIGGKLGTVGLNTVLCPIASSLSCFLIQRYYYKADPSFEHLVSCCFAGCVAIAAGAYSMPIWAAYVVGFLCPPVYFGMGHFIREKLQIDDPLSIVPIHFGCGMLGVFCEGVLADDSGYWDHGLIHGGFGHFGVQCLGIVVTATYMAAVCVLMWKLLLVGILFRNKDMRVSALDTYLGTKLFKHNTQLAFKELIAVNSKKSRQLLLAFHNYCAEHFCDEQLDFLIAVHVYQQLFEELMDEAPIAPTYDSPPTPIPKSAAKRVVTSDDSQSMLSVKNAIASGSNVSISVVFGKDISEQQRILFQSMRAIINSYVRPAADRSANISDMTRASMERRFDRSVRKRKIMLDRNMFANASREVVSMLMDPCSRFLSTYDRSQMGSFPKVRIPYLVDKHWCLHWDDKALVAGRQSATQRLVPDVIIAENERVGSLLRERLQERAEKRTHKTHSVEKDEMLATLYERLQKTPGPDLEVDAKMKQILEKGEESPKDTILELAELQLKTQISAASHTPETDTFAFSDSEPTSGTLSTTARYVRDQMVMDATPLSL